MSTQTLSPDTLQSLDILSPRKVESTTDLSSTTIWRLRRRREFPEPIQLSPGRVGYRRADIEAWITSRRTRG